MDLVTFIIFHSIQSLQKLEVLNISDNKFTIFPPSVYTLSSLEHLNVSFNKHLTSPDPKIVQLTQLRTLDTFDCDDLTSFPQGKCERETDAVRQYYKDLSQGVLYSRETNTRSVQPTGYTLCVLLRPVQHIIHCHS